MPIDRGMDKEDVGCVCVCVCVCVYVYIYIYIYIERERERESASTHARASLVGTKCRFNSWDRKICWRRDRPPTPVFLCFPCGSASKESACNAGDLGLIPGLGRFPGEGKGNPLQYSCLENSMDCIVRGGCKESDTTE